MYEQILTSEQAFKKITELLPEGDSIRAESPCGQLSINKKPYSTFSSPDGSIVEVTMKGESWSVPTVTISLLENSLTCWSGRNPLSEREGLKKISQFIGLWNKSQGEPIALDSQYLKSQTMYDKLSQLVADGHSPVLNLGQAWEVLNELLTIPPEGLVEFKPSESIRVGNVKITRSQNSDSEILLLRQISRPGPDNFYVESVTVTSDSQLKSEDLSTEKTGERALPALNDMLSEWLSTNKLREF